ETATSNSVTLVGPSGAVAASVVAAESGLLLAVTPTRLLERDTTYQVFADAVTDTAGWSLPSTTVQFTTGRRTTRDHDPGGPPPGGGTTPEPSPIPPDQDDERVPRDPRTGLPMSQWQSLPPLMAPPGVTAVSGQVLRLNGEPLADVTLSVGDV